MLNTKELSLDLGKRTSNQHVIIAQGDTHGTTIIATVYDHGVKLQDAGLEAYFVMLLPDNEHYVRDAATYDAGVITYTVNEAYAAAVEGYTPTAYFELRDGITTVATTERFGVTVEECAYDGLEPAESWDSAIAQLVIDGAEAVNAVEDALEDARAATEAALAAANVHLGYDTVGEISYLSVIDERVG